MIWLVLLELALTFTKVAGSKQSPNVPNQALSYNPHGTGKASRTDFLNRELSYGLNFNEEFPKRGDESVRFATFNVYCLFEIDTQKRAPNRILEIIKNLEADVFLLEEVPFMDENSGREELQEGLLALGYKSIRYFAAPCNSSNPFDRHGLMIASKYEIVSSEKLDLNSNRIMVAAQIQIGVRSVQLIGTHLDVSKAEARINQLAMISEYIETLETEDYVFLGDFNCQIHQELALLGQKDVFNVLKWARPHYTCWAGSEIDFIILGDVLVKFVVGAYTYHQTVSDHNPVVADFLKFAFL